MQRKAFMLVCIVIFGCLAMALVETVVEPGYVVKSAIKIALFAVLPLAVLKITGESGIKRYFVPNKSGFLVSLALGLGIYALIMGAFLLTKGVFDYSDVANGLATDQGVGANRLLPVAAYISFGNSLLEEFFFRVIGFLKLKEYIPAKKAGIFSSLLFAVYHVAMIFVSFPPLLATISLVGLFIGGIIFDLLDEKNGDIYNSWMVHMFADLAIMTIAFMMM